MRYVVAFGFAGLILSIGLAGCLGASEVLVEQDDPATAAAEDTRPGARAVVPTDDEARVPPEPLHALTWPAAPLAWETHVEGAFLLPETALSTQFATSVVRILTGEDIRPYEHVHDLTDVVPADVPVRVEVDVRATDGRVIPGMRGGSTTHATIERSVDVTDERNVLHATFLRRADEPALLVLMADHAYGVEVSYVADVHVRLAPELVVEGVPVAFSVDDAARAFQVTPSADASTALLLWGADDAFLGRFDLAAEGARIELPDDAPAGELVVFLLRGSATFAVSTVAPLRALDVVELRPGEPTAVNPGLTAWTFETPPHPLRVGLRLQTVDDTPRVLHDLKLSVKSPKGELIRVEALLWNGWSVTHWSDWHDERLDAASFDVALHVEEGTALVALALVHHWQR